MATVHPASVKPLRSELLNSTALMPTQHKGGGRLGKILLGVATIFAPFVAKGFGDLVSTVLGSGTPPPVGTGGTAVASLRPGRSTGLDTGDLAGTVGISDGAGVGISGGSAGLATNTRTGGTPWYKTDEFANAASQGITMALAPYFVDQPDPNRMSRADALLASATAEDARTRQLRAETAARLQGQSDRIDPNEAARLAHAGAAVTAGRLGTEIMRNLPPSAQASARRRNRINQSLTGIPSANAAYMAELARKDALARSAAQYPTGGATGTAIAAYATEAQQLAVERAEQQRQNAGFAGLTIPLLESGIRGLG
jgi:hypothetical protein